MSYPITAGAHYLAKECRSLFSAEGASLSRNMPKAALPNGKTASDKEYSM